MNAKTSLRFRVLLILFVCEQSSNVALFADEVLVRQNRKPVALAFVNEGHQLATANYRSGTISLVDLQDRQVVSETVIGKQLSDIVATGNPQQLLVTDENSHELIAVRCSSTECRVEKRLKVSPYPVSVRVNDEGTRAYVASLWSRTITVVDLAAWISDVDRTSPVILHQVRLNFCPREQLVVNTGDQRRLVPSLAKPTLKLVVADAFGSKLAVLDPESGQIDSVREIPAHAIRVMKLHPLKPRLMLTHQMLSRNAQTTFDDVHWGNLIVNCLRSLDLTDVLEPKSDLLNKSNLDFLGGPERGAADPSGFVFQANGRVVVAIRGADELVDDDGTRLYLHRCKVGECPTAIAVDPAADHIYVLNSLGDSISVVKRNVPAVVATISLGPRPEQTASDRGERLFHSAKLSHDSWISCASCHVDGHSNGLFNDNQTDGSIGTAKRILSLRGVTDTSPYAWNGRFSTLAEQIRHSAESTMHGEPLSDEQASDLEAYLSTLPPPPPVGSEDKVAVKRGEALFEKLDCRRCHAPLAFTSPRIVDVNLKDERGISKFNPPSLRGVSQNGPYFHDGRAENLREIFARFQHQLDRELSNDQITDLVAYLNSL